MDCKDLESELTALQNKMPKSFGCVISKYVLIVKSAGISYSTKVPLTVTGCYGKNNILTQMSK
jgi:hypothetical protein